MKVLETMHPTAMENGEIVVLVQHLTNTSMLLFEQLFDYAELVLNIPQFQ